MPTYYFVSYRYRKTHADVGSNRIHSWVFAQTVIDTHPVDWIRHKEATYGEKGWVARGAPRGHASQDKHWYEDYELMFFSEVPPDVGERAMQAEWGR